MVWSERPGDGIQLVRYYPYTPLCWSGAGWNPDESTILRFRHRLERNQLTENLFRKTEKHLSGRNLILNEGTIVDAAIIAAPSSTKNKDQCRDPDMKQTKKGNGWHFGIKVHVGTEPQGRAHSVKVSDAEVHDSQVMDDLLHGEEEKKTVPDR